MANSFTGFSEDDIRKVQNGLVPNKPSDNEPRQIKSSLKSSKKPSSKTNEAKTKKVIFSKLLSPEDDTPPIPEEAKLSLASHTEDDGKAKPEERKQNIEQQKQKIEQEKQEIEQKKQKIEQQKQKIEQQKQKIEQRMQTIEQEKQKIEQEAELPEKKFNDLEKFEARRKLIEEQNRRRKELLAKALADRTKQTQEEALRLNEIKNEFRQLDAMLSNDVKILRGQIEAASVEYMMAQKRYHKVEKEFLDAKLALQQKLEKKEMLTEHLCTIIEQNEERKGRKLTELLEKLELKGDMSDAHENDVNQIGADVQELKITSTNTIVPNL